MRLEGEYTFAISIEEAYELLLDPRALRECMPGCERLEPVSDSRFDLSMAVPVPAVKGDYAGSVEIMEREPPRAFTMRIQAEGTSGFVHADARMRLEAVDGGTLVRYDADARVGGPAASVGQRVLTGISRHQLNHMMRALALYRAGVPQLPLWRRILIRLRLMKPPA
jgi:carbon monoxide dehydrogenase subunit G